MKIEMLVTGDEIVRGAVVDTNSAWLLQRLPEVGASATRITAVGDVKADLIDALHESAARSDVVLISGGLGPTSDDLTAACAAEAAGIALVLDGGTLDRIKERWARRAKPMPPAVEKQALVPEGAEVLPNDEGTAPGFRLRLGKAECFFFAGVPREYRHLCERHFLPWLRARSTRAIRTRTLRCVSAPESELDALLLPMAKERSVRLGLRAVYPETWVSLTVEDASSEAAQSRLDAAVQEALSTIGTRCYSANGETLAVVVGQLLLQRGWTLSVAESCTGGLLGAALTDVAGSSRYFLGGALSYANEEKSRALGVPEELIRVHGAVSEQVARAMAEGIRSRTGSSCALAITGVAGPGGGTPEKPVGTVWIALATPVGTRTELNRFTRPDRESIRTASVSAALDLLRRELLEAKA